MLHIRKFMEWLSCHPNYGDIARALVTEHLIHKGVRCIRFGRVQSDDSAMVLGQYGYDDARDWKDKVVPGSEWRAWNTPEIDIITGKK